jgi:hypothetical protein
VKVGVHLLGEIDARRRCFDHHSTTITGIGQAPDEAGALKAIESQRHAPGGATEHLTNRGWGASMIGGSANNTEHEIVSDRNSRGSDDLVQHPIDRNVETHHVAEKPVGSGKLLSH